MPLPPPKESDNLVKDIEFLTKEVERLRISYEQYFLGLEREEPLKLRGTVSALIRKYSGVNLQNARMSFRIQQAVAKFNTYVSYWNRIVREIEEGKYNRDVFRARLHEQERKGEVSGESAPVKSPASPSPPDPVDALYHEYLDARKKCGEPVAGITLDSFRKSMTTQIAQVQQKTKGAKVTFKVVAEAGKAKIKAVLASPQKK